MAENASTLTRKRAVQHDFEIILLEREAKLINNMIVKYRSGELTKEEALITVGVLSEMRTLLNKMDKDILRTK